MTESAAPKNTTPPSSAPPTFEWFFRAGVTLIGVVLTLFVLSELRGVLLALVASLVLALGFQPSIRYLRDRGLSRGAAVVALVAAGALVGTGIVIMMTPIVLDQAQSLAESLPALIDQFRSESVFVDAVMSNVDLAELLPGESEGGGVSVVGMLGGIFNIITVGILTPYFAYSMPGIKVFVLRLTPKHRREEVTLLFDEAVNRISGFVAGNLFISVIAGLAAIGALRLIGVPYAAALALWIAITDLVPVVGAFIGAVPAVAVAYGELGPGAAVGVAIFILIYQQVENYIISPKVMGKSVDLSAPTVIIALMVGGALAGFLGALLALPVAALISMIIARFYIAPRQREIRIQGETGSEANAQRGPLP